MALAPFTATPVRIASEAAVAMFRAGSKAKKVPMTGSAGAYRRVWLPYSSVRQVPVEIEEAAYVDGAGRLQALVRIMPHLVAQEIVAITAIHATGSHGELLTPCAPPPRSSSAGSRGLALEVSERG